MWFQSTKRFAVITTVKSRFSVKKKMSVVITLFRTVSMFCVIKNMRLFCKREPSVLFYNASGFIISAYSLTLWFAIVKVINTTLILDLVSALAKLQQHESSSNGTHTSTRSVKLHTSMRIGYILIYRDKAHFSWVKRSRLSVVIDRF